MLPVTDSYDTAHLAFVSADPPAVDSNDDGELDWTDLIVPRGSDLASGDWTTVTTTFVATDDCAGELSGVNTAEIHDA